MQRGGLAAAHGAYIVPAWHRLMYANEKPSRGNPMPETLLFSPITIRGVTLKNRIAVPPMHQYSAENGFPTDWHLMNAGKFAGGGAGLVVIESTKVERRGCGTVGDLGIWDEVH
jgi:2,4-dienoyl-CoA reductase-like NADH-dependent reductase (Old Yellow Enzyme family)